jgi:hypothetical protein
MDTPAERAPIELGLDTFGDVTTGADGRPLHHADVLRHVVAEGVLADQAVGAHSPGHVATTDEQPREDLWPHYQVMMSRIGAERGRPPVTRAQFDREAGPDGSLYVGAPETVARKIAATMRTLGLRHST